MDIDPIPPTFDPAIAQQSSDTPSADAPSQPAIPQGSPQPSSTRNVSVARAPLPTRTLRARPSDPVSYAPPSKVVHTSTPTSREPNPHEIEAIKRKLGEEGISERREDLVREKEVVLKQLVEGHDAAVREKFHLERYISLLEGYDPEVIKSDNSPVFLEYVKNHHNLLDLLPAQPASAAAGPSRRPRSSLPARQTRRQAHEQSEILAHVVNTPTESSAKKAESAKRMIKVKHLDTPTDVKGKGKARMQDDAASPNTPKLKLTLKRLDGDVGSKGKRRASLEQYPEPSPLPAQGKRTRGSLLAEHPFAKRLKDESATATPSLDTSTPNTPRPPSEPPESTREPTPLPSLAHLPFPSAPFRPKERLFGPREPWYTMVIHQPLATRYGGDIGPIVDTYQDPSTPPLKTLELQAAREGYVKNRVTYLQNHGRLGRLLDEPGRQTKAHRGPFLPPRSTDFHDSLLAHMVEVRNAILNEAKQKPVVAKRIARMIQAYWEHIEGREERERAAEERDQKKRMKDLTRALRKRWSLAVKIVRARIQAAQKLEQDRLGKEHLQNMLQRSTGLLEAQRDDIAGEREDGDDDSGGTDDVSSAEESESDGDSETTGGRPHDWRTGPYDPNNGFSSEEDASEADEAEEEEDDGDDDNGSSASSPDLRALIADEDDEPEPMDIDEDGADTVANLPDPVSPAAQETSAEPLPVLDQSTSDLPPDPPTPIVGDAPSSPPRDLKAAPNSVLPPATILGTVTPPVNGSEILAQPILEKAITVSEVDHVAPKVTVDPGLAAPLAASHSSELPNPSIPLPNGHGTLDPVPLLVPQDPPSFEVNASSEQAAIAPTETPEAAICVRLDEEAALPLAPSEESGEPVQTQVAPPELTASSDPISTELPRTSPAPPELEAPQSLSISTTDEPMTPEPSFVSSRSRRVRKSYSHADLVKTEDPDINDTEFVGETSEIDEQDEKFDVDMEDDDEEEDDEDAGLLADADVPIEELLKRYGYGAPEEPAVDDSGIDDSGELSNGVKADEVETDKSLLDESLAGESTLIIEGKRQRRVRSVWTPEDNPQHMPKRPKVEEIESDYEYEMTPSVSESEEDEAEDAMEQDPNRVGPPFLLRGTLRPYQQAGLEWLASLYQNNMNGILADEMGLGKTIQTIALLGHLACDKGIWGQHLIIVPTSVILNWEMEFKKFLPGLKVLTYYGNQKERKDKRIGWNTENAWQVCITSYQIVLADQHIFRRKSWVYMILDEAHNIKNFRSQRWQTLLGFKAQRRLLLTGTPLQNNLMELWSLLYFLMPNGVTADATAVVGFANHKEFTEWFSNPMDKAVESGETLDQDTIETVAKLHTLLRPFILRRLKSEVETQLPGKFEHVVYCKLSKRQRFLYDEFMSRSSTKEALSSGGYLGVVNTLMQLRKVCNHPDLFEVRPVRTSFAMDPVLADYEPTEVLVRRRLLDQLDSVEFQVSGYEDSSAWAMASRHRLDASNLLPQIAARKNKPPIMDTRSVEGWLKYREHWEEQQRGARWEALRNINRRRCYTRPIYGSTLLNMLSDLQQPLIPGEISRPRRDHIDDFVPPAATLVHSYESRARRVAPLVDLFALIPPNAVARDMTTFALPGLTPSSDPALLDLSFDTLHQASVKLQIAFPDVSLLQYDCGKLQKLDEMLRDLKAGGHRVLIFTQMTRVLDILEIFLSYNGHRYLRLDGSTKIEDRQIITERFNSDDRIFCFIASSRSGGVGINLTGADTVFFYDSDWNPSMDRQCMDRAHRIGQTREVHIYRFVSSHTVEENMLKKANQKRLLDRVVIQEGEFTTDFFGKMDWRDVLDAEVGGPEEDDRMEDVPVEDEPEAVDVETTAPRLGEERELAKALAEVEDEEDAEAAKIAQGEGELDIVEFEEQVKKAPVPAKRSVSIVEPRGSSTPMASVPPDDMEEEDEDDVGAVDEYMLRTVEWDWEWFCQF